MLYLFDTDIASYIIKQPSPELESRLSGIEPLSLCVSAVTCAELLYGLKRLPPSHKLHAGVRQFLKLVTVLAWDAEAASFYSAIRHQLVTEGQPIGEMDMMIAAHALAAAATLVTNNLRHYERIQAPLLIDNWCETRIE